MPRYRNDSDSNIRVTDSNGFEKILGPDEEVNTDKYYSITDLTKVSDTPYLNFVAAYHVETFVASGNSTITLTSPSIPKIRVQKADGDFDIFLQSISNTPAVLMHWSDTDQPIDIAIDGICDQIVIRSNDVGSIHIVELLSK